MTPGLRPFYKYVSPETALLILRNKTVRYSSPLTFNDPFDWQSGLHFDFDLANLPSMLLDHFEFLAKAPTDPLIDCNDPFGMVIAEIRKRYPQAGFPRQKFEQHFTPQLAGLAEQIKSTQQQYQMHWTNLLPKARLFCVSEDRDNLLMWAHYAKDHRGAVLELWSIPDEDNPLFVAQSVDYAPSPPPFFTESEWIDDLTSIRKLDPNALYYRYSLAKSEHWSYEREWRVWYPGSDTDGLHDLMPLKQHEFKALYFGCRSDPDFVRDASAIASDNYPGTALYRARKSDDSFSLSYDEI